MRRCSSGGLSERSMTLAHVLLTGLDLALPEIYLPLGCQSVLLSRCEAMLRVRRQTNPDDHLSCSDCPVFRILTPMNFRAILVSAVISGAAWLIIDPFTREHRLVGNADPQISNVVDKRKNTWLWLLQEDQADLLGMDEGSEKELLKKKAKADTANTAALEQSHSDTHTICLGIFLISSLLLHIKPELLGKLNKPKKIGSTYKPKEDGPTDNDSDIAIPLPSQDLLTVHPSKKATTVNEAPEEHESKKKDRPKDRLTGLPVSAHSG
jgi:hypothetical protein